jgi:hypothetical protein
MITQLSQTFTLAATTSEITIGGTLSDIAVRLAFGIVLGICLSVSYILCNKKDYSRNFALSMILLPSMVAAIIWLIGNDITKAISLGGIFALIKFRSVPGDSKDILNVFITMAAGLAVGLGCYEAAVLITVVSIAVMMIFSMSPYGKKKEDLRQLRITVPENLNFEGVFDEILAKYASTYSLDSVKTTHMGTLFELTYQLRLKDDAQTKSMMDELRTRNGNLGIALTKKSQEKASTIL